MERLTYWCDDGMGGGEYRANENGSEYSGPSIDRLAAYEDTGLEPEDINDFVDSYKTMRDKEEARVRLTCGTGVIHPERAAEITKAESEGRLVVLPCKAGDMVYYLRGPDILGDTVERIILDGIDNQVLVGAHKAFMFCDFGRNVFRTREEAEAKLKEMNGDG